MALVRRRRSAPDLGAGPPPLVPPAAGTRAHLGPRRRRAAPACVGFLDEFRADVRVQPLLPPRPSLCSCRESGYRWRRVEVARSRRVHPRPGPDRDLERAGKTFSRHPASIGGRGCGRWERGSSQTMYSNILRGPMTLAPATGDSRGPRHPLSVPATKAGGERSTQRPEIRGVVERPSPAAPHTRKCRTLSRVQQQSRHTRSGRIVFQHLTESCERLVPSSR